ncbi:MAG: PIG-L family deacetylase [Acidobacteria bacterium]|nr:MAG: PIG-L family deacetylase [Acidobacteriota bacterium]
MTGHGRRARAVLQATCRELWGLGFAAAGRLLRPRATPWSPAAGTVLVVAPHPDDEVAGCGATLLAHRAAGDGVVVACLSDGRRSRALGLGPEAMAETRRKEAEAAAAVLGARLVWCGLREGEWRREEATAMVAELLRRLRPAVIYAPSAIDFHPEHRRAAQALAAALDDDRAALRVYPVQVPLTPPVINLACPAGERAGGLAAALAAYRSQLGSLERCLRTRRYMARLYRRDRLLEVFWQLPAATYRRLHPPGDAPADPPFRGLRYLALSDPLAFLAGRRARRRLALEARS